MTHLEPMQKRYMSWTRGALVLASISMAFMVVPAQTSQPQLHLVQTYGDFLDGDFENMTLLPTGELTLGPGTRMLSKKFAGPIISTLELNNGRIITGSAAPGRIYEVPLQGDPQMVVDLKESLLIDLIHWKGSEVIALTGPKPELLVINLNAPKGKRVTKRIALPNQGLIYDAAWNGKELLLVGGETKGYLYRWLPGNSKVDQIETIDDDFFRSIAIAQTSKGTVIALGSALQGVIYRWSKSKGLKALMDAEQAEVVDLVIDENGSIYAALLDASGKTTPGASKRSKGPSEKKKNGKKQKKKKKPRKIKSSEVIRVDTDGQVEILWQSKEHGGYALCLYQGRLLLGTGAEGRIYEINQAGEQEASLLARIKEQAEVSGLVASKKNGLIVATNHSSGIYLMSRAPAMSGYYFSAPMDAKKVAHYGEVVWNGQTPPGTEIRVDMRVGNTKKPDKTWSDFSPAIVRPGHLALQAARYSQIRVQFNRKGKNTPRLEKLRVSYLVENHRPAVEKVEVLTAGWRLEKRPGEKMRNRTVTLNADAFEKFRDEDSPKRANGKKRGSALQSRAPDYRSIFVWATDPDLDVLRYQYFIATVDESGQVGDWQLIKKWSTDPTLSLDGQRLQDGDYKVRVDVDDVPTNGFLRAKSDSLTSPRFQIARKKPQFADAQATTVKGEARVSFKVSSSLPLRFVTCAVGESDWVPVVPQDGILDGRNESFATVIPGPHLFGSVSCRAEDEGGNQARIDILLKR